MLQVIQPRRVVPVHSIAQWLELDQQTRINIQNHIRIKDRLLRWFIEKQNSQNVAALRGAVQEAAWVACRSCNQRGWVLDEPRYAGIHPSQFGQPCMLKIYNEMNGVPKQEKFDPIKQLIFEFGKALHRLFQGYGEAGAWGPHYQKEVTINGDQQALARELYIEGAADAVNVIRVEIPGYQVDFDVKVVHEYKSINSNQYKKLNSPKPQHKVQAAIYQKLLDAPLVCYLYMNKDNSSLSDYIVPYDESIWQTLYTKSKSLLSFYDANTPPPGDAGFHCTDCGYYFQCEYAKKAAIRKAAAR